MFHAGRAQIPLSPPFPKGEARPSEKTDRLGEGERVHRPEITMVEMPRVNGLDGLKKQVETLIKNKAGQSWT